MLSNCGAGEDFWESVGLQGDRTSQFQRKSTLNIHWKDWCWSCNILATWCEEPTHWKRLCCWERLRAGGEGGKRTRWWDGITDSMSKLQEIVKDRGAWHAAIQGSQRVELSFSDWTNNNEPLGLPAFLRSIQRYLAAYWIFTFGYLMGQMVKNSPAVQKTWV